MKINKIFDHKCLFFKIELVIDSCLIRNWTESVLRHILLINIFYRKRGKREREKTEKRRKKKLYK